MKTEQGATTIHTDHSDEAQVMALAAWFEANPRAVSPLEGESDAGRACRAMDAMIKGARSLGIVNDRLSAAVEAPEGAPLAEVLGVVITQLARARETLTEVLDYLEGSRPETPGGPPVPLALSDSMLTEWRSALARPYADNSPEVDLLAGLLAQFGIKVDIDPEAGAITFTRIEGPCGDPDCEACADKAAEAVTGTPMAEDRPEAPRVDGTWDDIVPAQREGSDHVAGYTTQAPGTHTIGG